MGAKGVKKALRPIARQVDVYRDFADQRIAVDSAIVLYRLAYVYRSQLARGDLQVVVDAFRRRMQVGTMRPGSAQWRREHVRAYARLGGGTPDDIHSDRVEVPRPAHCILDPTNKRSCPIRQGRTQLFYETYGHGSTRVMMVMGMAAIHLHWEPQLLHFGVDRASEYTVCVFDSRGVGFSEDCGGRWRTTDLAQDVLQLLDHLGWTDGCHLVGFSLGGMISTEAFLARPQLFRSLSMISSHAGGVDAIVPPMRGWLPFLRTFGSIDSGAALDAGLELLFPVEWLDVPSCRDPLDPGAPSTQRYERGRALMLRGRKYIESGHFPVLRIPGVIRQVGACMSHYVSTERLLHIRKSGVPVLCVCGSKDNLVRPSNSEHIARYTAGTLLRFPEAGHGCTEQQAEEVNKALEKVFKSKRAIGQCTPFPPNSRFDGFVMISCLVLFTIVARYVGLDPS
eukprot:TRINITY_DN4533_c0_g1_i1.p1 TRINITY_DN4533_c0_g1~~TRINITY_DN4533_c0_g1_i1.p1  ORF type:complete len:452 (+),score=67.74 TRINITY_DN4533_c0_g1_i1:292-1647(+)